MNKKHPFSIRWQGQRGQIALVVLLVMIVMLTLGISVAQRGLFDVRLSQQEEETSRAFQAAETGVEKALRTLSGESGSLGSDTTYNATVAEGGLSGFVTETSVQVGEALAVDVTGATGLSAVRVYFIDLAKEDCNASPPAVEVAVVRQSGPNTIVERSVFDVDSTRASGNGFDVVTKGSFSFEGTTFCARANVGMPGGALEVRVRPVYARSTLGIDPRPNSATLGTQFRLIRSEGRTGSGVTRAVEVQRTNPQVPTIFDYVLFSGGAIQK